METTFSASVLRNRRCHSQDENKLHFRFSFKQQPCQTPLKKNFSGFYLYKERAIKTALIKRSGGRRSGSNEETLQRKRKTKSKGNKTETKWMKIKRERREKWQRFSKNDKSATKSGGGADFAYRPRIVKYCR